jgi:hypothetical protein
MFNPLRFILIIFLSVCLAYLTQLAVPLMSIPNSYQHIAVVYHPLIALLHYSSGIARRGYYPLRTELMSYYTLVELPCLPCPELVLIETGNSSYK